MWPKNRENGAEEMTDLKIAFDMISAIVKNCESCIAAQREVILKKDELLVAEREANIAIIRSYLHRRAVLQYEIEECIAAIRAR